MSLRQWRYVIPLRMRSIFRRRQVERELDEELQLHLDMTIEANIARGMHRSASLCFDRIRGDGSEEGGVP